MLAAALDTSSSAYQLGRVAGIAIVAIVALLLVRRGLTRPGTGDKVIAIVAVFVAGFVVVKGVGGGGGGSDSPWSSNPGLSLKAGFIDGCSKGSPRRSCECMFERISSVAPYDRPNGFATLQYSVQRFSQTGDPNSLPRVMVDAARGCRA